MILITGYITIYGQKINFPKVIAGAEEQTNVRGRKYQKEIILLQYRHKLSVKVTIKVSVFRRVDQRFLSPAALIPVWVHR